MDTLDYTGPEVNEGSKGVWLGLGDPVRELPGRVRAPPYRRPRRDRRARVLRRLPGGRRAAATRTTPSAAARLAAHEAFAGWPLVVLSDEPARAARASAMNFLWTTFTRFEPARRRPRRRTFCTLGSRAPIIDSWAPA
jgi:4-hydroxybenzoate decarboxylase subunit C